MRAHAIVNPTAGGGRALPVWERVKPVLREAGWSLTETYSERRGHAIEVAEASSDDTLLAVGGDGTASEVANGILRSRRRMPMGVMPVGTGNDFARALNLPRDPMAAAAALVSSKPRALDVGEVNGRYYLTIAGAGFDGEVARLVNSWPKRFSGTAMYMLGILMMIATYRPAEVEITHDNTVMRQRLFLLAAANTAWNAGGMWLVPPARPDDGLLHAVVVGPVSRIERMGLLPKVFSGGHLRHPKVQIIQGAEIRVASDTPLAIQADGESVGTLPATFRAHPRALSVLAPPA